MNCQEFLFIFYYLKQWWLLVLMETIIRKMVNSTDSIIPLLKDQQNGFLVYSVVKEKSTIRKYVKCDFKS